MNKPKGWGKNLNGRRRRFQAVHTHHFKMTSTSANLVRSDEYTEKYIYLNTSDLGLDVLVRGKHKEMMKFITEERKNSFAENARLFKQTWVEIKKVTKDGTDKIYEVEPAWSNLCDDVFIFYALRFILFDKHIPIMMPSFAEQVLAKSNPDPGEVD